MFCPLLVGTALSLGQTGGTLPDVAVPGSLPSPPGTLVPQTPSRDPAAPGTGQPNNFPDYYWGAGETVTTQYSGPGKEAAQTGQQRDQGPSAKAEEPAPTEQAPKRRSLPSPWESPRFRARSTRATP
jgi:hypothetical protein